MKTVYPTTSFQSPPARQRGAVTLFVALIALVLITIMTVYTASVGVMDQRMSGNELRHQQAEAAAEAGLNQAVAYFKAQPTFAIATSNLGATAWTTAGNYTDVIPAADLPLTLANGATVQWARAIHCTEALVTTTCPTPKDTAGNAVTTPYNYNVFRAQGVSDDGTGTAAVQQQIAFASNIAPGGSTPEAPLTAAGIVPMGGNYNVVGNPNGGGPGVAVSVWSSAAVTGSGSSSTCNQPGYDAQTHQCTSDKISTGGTMGLDVVQNDPLVSAGGHFPDDVFQYFFGIPSASWQTVYDMAQHITDCSTLGPTSGGLIWYTGALCDLPSNTTIGATADDPATAATEGPVILVIQDAGVKMNANTVFNGVIFLFSSATPPVAPGTVQLNGGPVINGAFLSNSGLDNLSGAYTVKYDADILAQLAPSSSGNNNNAINGHPADVPGSWRDF